ncbi:EspA/EspE family type VII secretion system effector [Mycobacterium sp. 155]|uniref:EspA/EspE family type VII secretion system effector n=1 Tax=Mycobacterium sp. 155 TaxID=1157943 RepID=UPI0003813D16|nr:EspA/EspE family type VII secretion system effector [Mycobacterium sp. 155]
MSALDAFYSTWNQARNTFGSGVPQSGAEFDRSSQLRQMQSAVEAATPDSRWQGSAADAYTAKNQQHAAAYGKLADLDQRMAAEVDRSAAVVTAGRQNLDQIRDWVTSTAASAPNDKSSEYVKLAIASKGLGRISDIIQQSNSEMSAIGERIRGIAKEYDEIAGAKATPAPARVPGRHGPDEAAGTGIGELR